MLAFGACVGDVEVQHSSQQVELLQPLYYFGHTYSKLQVSAYFLDRTLRIDSSPHSLSLSFSLPLSPSLSHTLSLSLSLILSLLSLPSLPPPLSLPLSPLSLISLSSLSLLALGVSVSFQEFHQVPIIIQNRL